jgi:RNA polymerase sigma-70 factor (ECF subfamily)
MEARVNDLITRAVQGNRDALREVFQEHGPAVRRRLAGRIPRRHRSVLSVDDVMQETYAAACLHIHEFVPQGPGSFAAWLTTLATNNLIDAIRSLEAEKRGGKHRRLDPASGEDSLAALHELLEATNTTPSSAAVRNEAVEALRRALRRLPGAYRRVVTRYYLDGDSVEAVALAEKCSKGAVFMRLARALDLLRGVLGRPSHYL